MDRGTGYPYEGRGVDEDPSPEPTPSGPGYRTCLDDKDRRRVCYGRNSRSNGRVPLVGREWIRSTQVSLLLFFESSVVKNPSFTNEKYGQFRDHSKAYFGW